MRRVLVLAATVALMGAGEAPIPYPDGFRAWTHVSSGVIGPTNPAAPKYEGLHAVYANPAALEGYRSGAWPDGAVIVFDQWTWAKAGPDATGQGERKFIDVMVRDSRRYAATGGWGYTEFAGAGRERAVEIEKNMASACSACHAKSAPGGDHVFTTFKD